MSDGLGSTAGCPKVPIAAEASAYYLPIAVPIAITGYLKTADNAQDAITPLRGICASLSAVKNSSPPAFCSACSFNLNCFHLSLNEFQQTGDDKVSKSAKHWGIFCVIQTGQVLPANGLTTNAVPDSFAVTLWLSDLELRPASTGQVAG